MVGGKVVMAIDAIATAPATAAKAASARVPNPGPSTRRASAPGPASGDSFGETGRIFPQGFGYLALASLEAALASLSRALDQARS